MDVRLKLDHLRVTGERLFCLGRELARRRYVEYYVDLGQGVAVVAGGFPPQGGGRRGPALDPEPGTVLEVRDVPVAIAERMHQKHPEAVEIMGKLDLTKLQQEREFLAKRLAELDEIIARHAEPKEDDLADLQDDDDGAPAASGGEAR